MFRINSMKKKIKNHLYISITCVTFFLISNKNMRDRENNMGEYISHIQLLLHLE